MTPKVSLYELVSLIKETISINFDTTYWVRAEINDLHVHKSSGHCYLELIEKDPDSDEIYAKSRAYIWKSTFSNLYHYFKSETKRELGKGINVLVKVIVEFHEIYGFGLNIIDIDPAYTLGDIEKRRQEVINRLKKEGVFDLNKSLELPIVPQKVAIISSSNAAGYGDFIKQLQNNKFGYQFYLKLFPAVMQGDKAENSIIKAFDKIYKYEQFFDVVVLIRGGGSKSDLDCFDKYKLAQNIAQFPLPVITGIGHERDNTIADMVAFKSCKTPTAVAEFLITTIFNFESDIADKVRDIIDIVQQQMMIFKNDFIKLNSGFAQNVQRHILKNIYKLDAYSKNIENKTEIILKRNSIKMQHSISKLRSAASIFLKNIEREITNNRNTIKTLSLNKIEIEKLRHQKRTETVFYLNPKHVLDRGYTLTFADGKRVKDISELKDNDEIVTIHKTGFLHSRIEKINKKKPIN
ncbi:MAG: exodeoxyribonuclease VII large subunit [Marinilabiliales bacterium]